MKTFLLLISFIFIISSLVYGNSITLDYVEGAWDDGGTLKLIPGCDITFYLNYDNSDGPLQGGMTNGYKIWTVGGTPFKPVTGEFNTFDHPWETYFDKPTVFHWSCDGIGADTIGFGGVVVFTGTGLPVDIYYDAIIIRTGDVQFGETLCIDSTWYPSSGSWKWAPGGVPDWGGPYCYQSVSTGHLPPQFTNFPDDTLIIPGCGMGYYDFDGALDPNDGSGNESIYFALMEGSGEIDMITGEWSYDVKAEDFGTVDSFIVSIYKYWPCAGRKRTLPLKFERITSRTIGDINVDCAADIEDLVDYVEFQFNNGPAPVIFEHADCDGSGELDIADLVWMVDWMFNEGPPPYNPWG